MICLKSKPITYEHNLLTYERYISGANLLLGAILHPGVNLHPGLISQFKIPSCEKNATLFGFISFIYLNNI